MVRIFRCVEVCAQVYLNVCFQAVKVLKNNKISIASMRTHACIAHKHTVEYFSCLLNLHSHLAAPATAVFFSAHMFFFHVSNRVFK